MLHTLLKEVFMHQPISEQLKQKYHKTETISNLKDLLYRSASIYSSRIAFKLKDENNHLFHITYHKLKEDVVSLGTYFMKKGLQNKRIAIIGKNSYQWCVSYLAATIVGIVVPIDKELHHEDVINFMNVANVSCILGDSKNIEDVLNNKENLTNKNIEFIYFEHKKNTFEQVINEGRKLYLKGNTDFDKIVINPDELKILLFTSGTTGNAKGVCLSHKNVCSNILSIYGIVKVRKSDLFFSILPLHHTYECTIGFLLPLYGGASICHCEGLRYITKNLVEYHPSVILCVPLLLENVYKNIIKNMNKTLPKKYQKVRTVNEPIQNQNPFNNLPFLLKQLVKNKVKKSLGGKLRVFIVGAAAINPDIVTDIRKMGLNVLQGYGLTECAPLVAGNTDFFQKDDSCGLPIPNVEYQIESPNEDGIGEIIVKGPNVMLGYYEDEEATNHAIIHGWFHTGDLGKIDENGYLYITGRCKSVIVTKNGKNIYPEEIEYYLNNSPIITESLVLGIQKENDDETYINAQIYPNVTAITEELNGKNPTKEEIRKMISDTVANINCKMPNYKHIKSFIIRDTEFEKTTTQKIKRYGSNIDEIQP